MHLLQSNLPAFNHFVQTESFRTIPLPGIIEFTSIDKRTFIVYRHHTITTGSNTSLPCLQYPVKYSGCQFFYIFLRTQRLQELLILLFVFFFTPHNIQIMLFSTRLSQKFVY